MNYETLELLYNKHALTIFEITQHIINPLNVYNNRNKFIACIDNALIYENIFFGVFIYNRNYYISNNIGNLPITLNGEIYKLYWPNNLNINKLKTYNPTGIINILLYINNNIKSFEEELLSQIINKI